MNKDNSFVYVMVDGHTGYYKIGKGNNPSTRERTLLSQAPLLKLLQQWKVKNARQYEKVLHFKFAEKHIRGEWFALDNNDLDDINVFLANGGAPLSEFQIPQKKQRISLQKEQCFVRFFKQHNCATVVYKEFLCYSHYREAVMKGLIVDSAFQLLRCDAVLPTGRCKTKKQTNSSYCYKHTDIEKDLPLFQM